ncbi:PKD domain-containing protein [Candidatus Bathyarchaeota archaeon]|nr:MAG: PKD domain-containing protein [Candidatus Bathyarchaeota archaeon]
MMILLVKPGLSALIVLIILSLSLPNMHTVSSSHAASSTPAQPVPGAALVAVNPSRIADLTMVSGHIVFEINVTAAPSINGFGVVLSYNTTVLKAIAPLDYSSTVLNTAGTPIVVRNCVDGFGPSCFSQDTPGIISLALILTATATLAPTSGTLFKVTLNIVGKGLSEIHMLSAVLTSGVNPDIVPSDTSDGYFTNIDCPEGSGRLCMPPITDFTIVPPGPYAGVTATFNASASLSTNPQGIIKKYSWQWGDGGPPTITTNPVVQHLFTIAKIYTVTLIATDSFGISASKSSRVSVPFQPPPPPNPDFALVARPDDLFTFPGGPLNSTITGLSINGFAGQVSFSTSVSPLTGLTMSLSPPSLSLSPNKNANASLQVVASRMGLFVVNVTGASGTFVHSVAVTVHVGSAFAVLPSPTFLQVFTCSSKVSTIFLLGPGSFAETIQLSSLVSPPVSNGPAASLNPTSVILNSSGFATSTLVVSADASTAPGYYLVAVTGTGGASTASEHVLVQVVARTCPPLFSELHWRHRLSITRDGGVQTFTVGLLNPNTNVTLYARVQISIIGDTGIRTLSVSSVVFQLLPGQTLSDARLAVVFNSGDIGHSFTFTGTIQWGSTPADLSAVSTQLRDMGTEDFDESKQAAGVFTVKP